MIKKLLLPTRLIVFIGILSMLISSCSVTLISEYDEITDRTITELQSKTSRVLVQLEEEAGSDNYSNYKTFYRESKASLNDLLIRANAIEKNQITVDHITLLSTNYSNMEKLHIKKLTKEDVQLMRSAFNRSFTAMVKLQLAKKRGEKKPN